MSDTKQPIRKKGVLVPADNSFEAINNFIHATPSPEYEELQWALLGLASAKERRMTQKHLKGIAAAVAEHVHKHYGSIASNRRTIYEALRTVNQ